MREMVQLLSIAALAGCAGGLAQDCAVAGPAAFAGGTGLPQNGACASSAAIDRGPEKTLAEYCTAENGFAVGAAGGGFLNVCPEAAANEFRDGYGRGEELHRRQLAFQNAEQALSDARISLWEVKRRIAEVELAIASPTTPRAERAEYRAELQSLEEERIQLETNILMLQQNNRRAGADLADYRASLAAGDQPRRAVEPQDASY